MRGASDPASRPGTPPARFCPPERVVARPPLQFIRRDRGPSTGSGLARAPGLDRAVGGRGCTGPDWASASFRSRTPSGEGRDFGKAPRWPLSVAGGEMETPQRGVWEEEESRSPDGQGQIKSACPE